MPFTPPTAAVHPALERAVMIGPGREFSRIPLLSKHVVLTQDPNEVVSAILVATAHGIYEARVAGTAVSQSVLNPGWTAYEERLQVQSHDVTQLLRVNGREFELEVLLAGGWWKGNFGHTGLNANYGTEVGFLGALTVAYSDGRVDEFVTDESWDVAPSHVESASIYDGQREDRRWGKGASESAHIVEFDRATLVPQIGPLVMRHEVLPPLAVWTSPAGKVLLDFGQNIVGWLRFTVTGKAGTEITIRHAEILEDGELGTRFLRGIAATDRLVLSGAPGGENFEPTLTFHGFRYAEITGWPSEASVDNIEAVVVHSDIPRTGWFECSDDRVNRLVQNSIWSQKGNFLAVPTDCPQRDERLGWTGDIAVFAPSAAFQFDVSDFLHQWLLDLRTEAAANGGEVPFIVPDVLKYGPEGELRPAFTGLREGPTAIWGDAAVWVPQALWRAYGDEDRLAAHYPAMVAHLESVERRLSDTGLWDRGFQFGDWLDPDAPAGKPGESKADKGVVATACLYRSAAFTAETASILGNPTDAERWRSLADRTRIAFLSHYVNEDGTITSDCATVYALAIHFGILTGDLRQAAGARLAALVREAGYFVSTGFAGTPYVTWALSETGFIDEAYALLLQSESPSWLYPVTTGATTIWEVWDAILPDGSPNTATRIPSFNHYALGSVVDWIYQVVLGIRAAEPGYSHIRIEPQPGPGIDHARGALESRIGRIEVAWTSLNGEFSIECTVPNGATADLVMPNGTIRRCGGGIHRLKVDNRTRGDADKVV